MKGDVSTFTASGFRCPQSGSYESQTVPPATVEMTEGQSVPLLKGKIAYWKLLAQTPKTSN